MNKTDSRFEVIIIGAGISGLTLGWSLSRMGRSVRILEAQSQPGGAIRSVREGEWLAECGPGSILVSSGHITDLIHDAGLDDKVVKASPEAKKRYVVKDSRPVPVPASLWQAARTPLLSARAKLSALGEPFVGRASVEDESLADFVRRRLGQEFLDQFINPLVGGIYAGDPEKLSVRYGFPRLQALEDQHGSVFKGQLRGLKKDPARREIPRNKAEILSFKEGLQQLAGQLAHHLEEQISYNTRIEAISTGDNRFTVTAVRDGNQQQLTADKVILTIPLHKLKDIQTDFPPNEWQRIQAISYVPVSVINLGYNQADIGHPLDGFGILVPQKEPYRLLGVQFNSSVFPNRAPEGGAMLTVFLGGMRYPGLVEKPAAEQLEIARSDLRKLLDITGEPEFENITVWPKAIPQYEVGYQTYLETFRELEESRPGLHFAGNYRGGISVGDCITNSILLAEELTGKEVVT